jgi:hypothetical protein
LSVKISKSIKWCLSTPCPHPMKGIVMKWSLMLLTLSLMLASAPASAQQSYTLTVPVYKSVPASLARMREVLIALKATFGTEATLGYVTATFGNEARQVSVLPDGTSIDRTTIQATRLNVSCIDIAGGAEALCREIQRRYEGR